MSLRRATVACGAALILGVASGCSDDESGGDAADVKVGVVLSLTGPAGSLGVPELESVEAFKDRLGSAAGTSIEWIVEDDGSDPTKAVAAVNRLISEDGVDAVLCCSTSPNSLAVQSAAEAARRPNVSLAAASAIVEPAEEKRWSFKTPINDRLLLDVATDDMLSQGLKSVAFLGSDDAFGESGLKEFQALVSAKGIDVAGTEKFANTDTDITAQLTQLRGSDPDAYVIWGIPPAAAIAQRNLRGLGIEAPVYQSTGVASQQFIKLAGGSSEDVVIAGGKLIALPALEGDDPLEQSIRTFAEQYERHGGSPPNAFAGYAYDAMLIVHDAVKRAVEGGAAAGDDAFGEVLRDQIEKTSNLAGATGIYSFSPTDHAGLDERSVIVTKIKDGAFVPVDAQ